VFIAPPFKNEETNLYCLCVSDDGFIIICASWFIGTLPTTGNIDMLNCLTIGFIAFDATASNDLVWTNQAAGNGVGSIGVAP